MGEAVSWRLVRAEEGRLLIGADARGRVGFIAVLSADVARTDLGLTYYLRKPPDLDQAIATFREALSRNPKHEKTLQNLITALIDNGDAPAARAVLKELEGVNPGNPALPQFRERLGTK